MVFPCHSSTYSFEEEKTQVSDFQNGKWKSYLLDFFDWKIILGATCIYPKKLCLLFYLLIFFKVSKSKHPNVGVVYSVRIIQSMDSEA